MNPILQALTGNSNISKVMNIAAQLKNGNPEAIYNQMMQTNPQFKMFVDVNKNKTPEQIAQENGIDLSILRQFMK